MWTVIYNLIKDFGALGVGIAQFILIICLVGKLCNNHLKHLKMSVDENIIETKNLVKSVGAISERVAKLEGQHAK